MPKNPEAKALIEQAIEEIKKKKQFDKEAGGLLASMEEGLVKAIGPALERVISQMEKSIKGVKMDAPQIDMPSMELDMGPVADAIREAVSESFKGVKINVPEVKLPTINVPEMRMPTINIPPQTINEVSLRGVNAKNPIPVLLHGTDGQPILNFGGSGGKANFLTIKGMLTAGGDSMLDETNDALRVNVVAGSTSGTQYTEGDTDTTPTGTAALGITDAGLITTLRIGSGIADKALRVVHATDVAMSVNIVSGSSSGTQYNDGATPDQAGGTGTLSMLFDGGSAQSWNGSSYGIGQVQLAGFDGSLVGITNNALDVNIGANSIEVKQVSGFSYSVEIASQPITLDVKQASGFTDSVNLLQVNGAAAAALADSTVNPTTFSLGSHLMGYDNAATTWDRLRISAINADALPAHSRGVLDVAGINLALNPSGTYDRIRTQSGTADGALRTVLATDVASSVNVATLNGVAPDLGAGSVGTGTMRVVVGNDSTTMVVGDVLADVADTGGAPVKVGGIARQANPTAVAAGDRVAATFDDLGRQVMRINQVRDLMQTAYATLSNGTETTLLAGASGVFHDLVYLMGANDSGVAVQVDIRSATGANKVMTLEIPANGTAGVSLPIPLPQDVAADTWTADMADITGTNVYLSALFSKEV